MGTYAEDAALPVLSHPTPEARLLACQILAEVGTAKSVTALRKYMSQEYNRTLDQAAQYAIQKILARDKLDVGSAPINSFAEPTHPTR
jgi:hypothetical protein